MLHMACSATQVIFAKETTLRHHSTKFHGSIPIALSVRTVPRLLMLWLLWYTHQRLLPQAREPHCTVSTVSKLHCGADIEWIAKHDMLLHIMLHAMQVCQKQILCRHQIANVEHDYPEVLVVLCHRCQLAQVKQLCLVAQRVVEVPKLSLQLSTEILPSTNPQLSPTFCCNRMPPGECLPCQQCHSHLHYFF